MTQAPETRYARAADGIHVGYQVVGSGPVDIVFVPYDYSNIEAAWDFSPFVSFVRGLTSIGRVLVFDRRGSGTSDRSWTGEAPRPMASVPGGGQVKDYRDVVVHYLACIAGCLYLSSGD